MDFGGKSLSIKFYDTGLFKYYLWNGPAFSDVNNNLPPIIGFSLNTNMSFLTKEDIKISDDGDTVFIDWHWGTFDKSTFVQLDFAFANVVAGNSKGNTLKGTKAVDYVTGGEGADTMSGGRDADVFIFRKGDTGSTKKKADLITDFSAKQGDRIDLHKWDADTTTKGVQDFDFIGKHKFTKEAGELRYQKSGSETLLLGDTNGDGKADFMIRFKGSITFTDDLLLL
jgi:Ca2+-binding RTX toxin-like protein